MLFTHSLTVRREGQIVQVVQVRREDVGRVALDLSETGHVVEVRSLEVEPLKPVDLGRFGDPEYCRECMDPNTVGCVDIRTGLCDYCTDNELRERVAAGDPTAIAISEQ